jgi:mannose-6-phosphate isomerase-like protein (cupin superfamily)
MPLSRRSLFQGSLLTLPFLFAKRFFPQAAAESLTGSQPAVSALNRNESADVPVETPAYVVRSGESRAGEPWKALGAPHFWVKISGADVGGHLAIIEVTTPAGEGPPIHVHADQNEFMYIVEGSFGVQVNGKRSVLKAGDCYMVPKGMPHAFLVLGTQPARHLNVYDPAASIEAFFESYDRVHGPKTSAGSPPPLGPPLKASDFAF